MSEIDLNKLEQVYKQKKYNLTHTGEHFKQSRQTITNKLKRAGLFRQQETKKLGEKAERNLKKEIKDLSEELAVQNKFLKKFKDLGDLAPPEWMLDAEKDETSELPVLFTSDFQWGEVVLPEEVESLNAYNKKIAKERYRKLISKTIQLYPNPKHGLILLRAGDSVSGNIHEELRNTNDLAAIPAVLDLAEEETAGIIKLKEHFGKVLIISVPGNHGRSSEKPPAKGYVMTNYDTLVTMLISQYFRDDSDLTFYTPLSGDAYFTLFGHSFLLTHGDRIGSRGGQGFIGPVAPISRGVVKLRQQYAQVGKHVDCVLLGHFHVPMVLPRAIVNGSLVGFSEFARQIRVEPDPPC